jgi:hypothetical protein
MAVSLLRQVVLARQLGCGVMPRHHPRLELPPPSPPPLPTCSSVDTPGSQLGPAHVPNRLKHTCSTQQQQQHTAVSGACAQLGAWLTVQARTTTRPDGRRNWSTVRTARQCVRAADVCSILRTATSQRPCARTECLCRLSALSSSPPPTLPQSYRLGLARHLPPPVVKNWT